MALYDLADQFTSMQATINLGRRRAVAQAAHLEVRDVLRANAALRAHGLDDVLIGSYARDTGIWPGKDVDIFGKLTNESIFSMAPEDAYQLFLSPLQAKYASRLTEQPRSIKIAFGRDRRAPAVRFLEEREATLADTFEFSVDVVPAVRWDDNWGIPAHDTELWQRVNASERWVRTDPEGVSDLSRDRNGEITVAGQGAFVPTVKAIKQIRRAHLGDNKPGGLYYEFILHEGFAAKKIKGSSWADLTASALDYIANRLCSATLSPVCDPALEQPFAPAAQPAQLAIAVAKFEELASLATTALTDEKCPAAAKWREIFGSNGNGDEWVFPLPAGCRADGTIMVPAAAANALRGSNEARGFGVA